MDRKNAVDAERLFEYGKYILMGLVAFIHAIPELTWFLITIMAIDSFFGLMVAIKERHIDPDKASKSATTKVGKLAFIVLMAVMRKYIDIGVDFVQVATVFYIGPELLHIMRKMVVLEIPVPSQFAQIVQLFQDKGDANKSLS